MTDTDAKTLGDWELIKPLVSMPGWAAMLDIFERQKKDLMERAGYSLELLIYADTPENRKTWQDLRVEILGLEAAIKVYAVLRQQVSDIHADIFSQEGDGTPGHSV